MRTIVGLASAETCDRPGCIPVGRPRGRKAAGLKYERDLAAGVRGGIHGQWFKYCDRAGFGWCQTDILVRTEFGIAVLESKYTWTEQGHKQLDRLYIPVVERVWNQPAFGIVVCKVLTRDVSPSWVCRDLASAVQRSSAGLKTVLHWVGVGLAPLALAA